MVSKYLFDENNYIKTLSRWQYKWYLNTEKFVISMQDGTEIAKDVTVVFKQRVLRNTTVCCDPTGSELFFTFWVRNVMLTQTLGNPFKITNLHVVERELSLNPPSQKWAQVTPPNFFPLTYSTACEIAAVTPFSCERKITSMNLPKVMQWPCSRAKIPTQVCLADLSCLWTLSPKTLIPNDCANCW